MRPLALLAALALLGAALPLVEGQGQAQGFRYCGDPAKVSLVFLNPDLKIREDGYVHASGTFFIQFQAIGSEASRVAKIAFSYGKPIPEGTEKCDAPGEPVTGAYYLHRYRIDDTPQDGFFVPINTTLVPDGEYGAAITAYDQAGQWLGRFYTRAIVENGPNCWPARQRCEDTTQPWPMILPGDGEQLHEPGALTIEFAEPVADITVKINGVQVVAQPWTPPARDDDAKVDNDGEDCAMWESLEAVYGGNNLVCHRTVWGSGYRLALGAGLLGDLKPRDVIEVRAIDTGGNEATKIVTVGGSTQGGAIELKLPEIQLSAENTEQEVEAGQAAEYRLKLVNVGQGDAEVRMTIDAPNSTAVEWSSPTVTVAPGAEQFVDVKVTPIKEASPGGYTLLTRATYKSGTEDQTQQLTLSLRVTEFRPVPESPLRKTRANLTETSAEGDAPAPKGAPGLEGAAVLGALALVALAAERRRRR